MSIKDFRDRDFSEYCEYIVAFKLQSLGWKVFQPLSDRYIDIVAYKILDEKPIIRTIQVKGSRLELEGKKLSYGLTHKPKDLLHHPGHFFIWLFYGEAENENFIILSVSDFIKIMGYGMKTMSWRKGNNRIHFASDLKNTYLKDYLNKWDNLLKGGKDNTDELCIKAQEIDTRWLSNKSIALWNETNKKVLSKIPKDMLEKIRRKTEVGD